MMETVCLDDRLPKDHQARLVWNVVEGLDLSRFYAPLKARGSVPGRSATDPGLQVALWLYATIDGVGSARELARLCGSHDAYRWLCGGVSVNHHTLSDFRVEHEEAVDALLTQVVAVLVHNDVVEVVRISQDGTRIRASAGSSSFRREKTLRKCLKEAKARVKKLKRLQDRDTSAREVAARERAAKERVRRLEAALAELPKIEQMKAKQKQKPSKERPPRVSTTDPEARVMKMGDSGFRPAYNVQFATDTASRAIAAVEVTNEGSDVGQATCVREQAEERTGLKVAEHLMDGGYVGLKNIDEAAADGVTVYAPVPKSKNGGEPHAPRKSDSEAVAAWRERMATPEAKEIYKQRGSTAETVNADAKAHRGLGALNVRGTKKVRTVAIWFALAYNIMHFGGVMIT